MFIVMHCGGLPFNGATINEKSLGGSETAAYYLAKELASHNHKVTLFTNSQDQGEWDGVRYIWAGQVTEQFPLGTQFHHYAENTPHDVNIIQRHPFAYRYGWASKKNYWWLHDLALGRMAGQVNAMLWNIDGILTVSEFHKAQVCESWGISADAVHVVRNGVNLNLFDPIKAKSKEVDNTYLFYSSRPERGLEHLVAPGGIMDKLGDGYHLYVCSYDNTTDQMRDYYAYLYDCCERMPNVHMLGNLTKARLGEWMNFADIHVYPTPGPQQPDFVEVSCITAMEAMAAGNPFISSDCGALPETCEGSGSVLLPLVNGLPSVDAFVEAIKNIDIKSRSAKQLEAAKSKTWAASADAFLLQVDKDFSNKTKTSELAHYLHTSDIYAANYQFAEFPHNAIADSVHGEINECYNFAFTNTFAEYYARYYQYEKDRGVIYGPENMDNNDRFEFVSNIIKSLPVGSAILDYGCAHGLFTVNLAKRFPEHNFIGIDISEENIGACRKWVESERITNVEFRHGAIEKHENTNGGFPYLADIGSPCTVDKQDKALTHYDFIDIDDCHFDLIIAAEVLEHVSRAQDYVDALAQYLKPDGRFYITVPFGPWESEGYITHWPWRAHLHHFERQDLHDMLGMHPGFAVTVAPAGMSRSHQRCGNYLVTFGKPSKLSGYINYMRKEILCSPRQTVSLCMIVKNAENSLKTCLDSVSGIINELIIGFDVTTCAKDKSKQIAQDWAEAHHIPLTSIDIESPLVIGFDSARNQTIDKACGDWILWLDSDEYMVHSGNLHKYLRNNAFNGYAIQQHHISAEPVGLMKTDLPVKLFRNHKGINFIGKVHEHPEKALNQGVGYASLIDDVCVMHNGYTDEHTRRQRFQRNINLMQIDRQANPDRRLGMFLWIRDLAQMCRYTMERNGNYITPEMKRMADEGLKIWEELLALNEIRMLTDGMEFYDTLSQIKGDGIAMSFAVGADYQSPDHATKGAKVIKAYFAKKEHAENLMKAMMDDSAKPFQKRYF